ncbi:MAG: DNA repair protein RecO [Bacteroidota bacterium]|nr:DNA repair protein RecO [Bacteroidota bacterium]
MITSTKAIVLSKLKYKDHDLIVKCYTASNGILSFLIRGAFSTKKTKLKPAYFQPLSMLRMQIDFKNNRQLHFIKNVRMEHVYRSLHVEITKSTVVIFLSEILNSTLKEEEPNEGLYTYIETALLWFDTVDKSRIFHHQFLMGLTKYMGVYPEMTNAKAPYFNLEAGKYQEQKSGRYCISGAKLILFNSVLGMKFDNHKENTMQDAEKRLLLTMILQYFKLHLQGFKSPKSLPILNQVLN